MTEIFWWLLQTTFTVAVLIAIVAAASRFLQQWPAVQHALWVIVLLKMFTPPLISWPWAAPGFLPQQWQSTPPR